MCIIGGFIFGFWISFPLSNIGFLLAWWITLVCVRNMFAYIEVKSGYSEDGTHTLTKTEKEESQFKRNIREEMGLWMVTEFTAIR